MDYYHQHRETLGDLPFLRASQFAEEYNGPPGRYGGLRTWGTPQDLERLQHLLHEQGK